ncbi:hypothetical protein GCM10025734_15660 [Kitasatospora paranensis]
MGDARDGQGGRVRLSRPAPDVPAPVLLPDQASAHRSAAGLQRLRPGRLILRAPGSAAARPPAGWAGTPRPLRVPGTAADRTAGLHAHAIPRESHA